MLLVIRHLRMHFSYRFQEDGFDLEVVGFSDEELRALVVDGQSPEEAAAEDVVPEAPANPVTRPGDVSMIAGTD